MLIAYYIFTALVVLVSIFPFIPNQHWMFRVWEFGRIQILFLQLIVFAITINSLGNDNYVIYWIIFSINLGLILHNIFILFPYTTFYKKNTQKVIAKHSETISIISVNVYQFNSRYNELIDLIEDTQPDILLTMESNQDWDEALAPLEKKYPNFKKVPLENTYGIHFYTRLKAKSIKINYFVADDLPSVEARLLTGNGIDFTFFGLHPPPPSPTEEENSKERDGELLSVAKKVQNLKEPVIVVGDFNNVAWAKSSILFRKTSELIDPRIGRGFVSTFHAKYKLLRFPIDLFFHSTDIFIEDFKTLRNIGSDHLPLFCKFFINKEIDEQEEEVETLEKDEIEEVLEIIEDGVEEESDRPDVVTE